MTSPPQVTSPPPKETLHSAAVAAMLQHGFEPHFSAAVMREVGSLDDPSNDPLPPGVHDLRSLLWSSIDNRESRDLDQIEVAERIGDGSIRIRIGVADVGALVQLGSAADDHAATNTTSVYTGVAVFPMLPERLSNDLTSLGEGEDRFAVVVEFEVTAGGALANASVYHGLVHNRAKLTYEGVGLWLEDKAPAPPAIAAYPQLQNQLRMQDEAAQRLRRARSLAGALDFESIEARPVVVHGKVVDLAVTRRNRARDMIEDFMVPTDPSLTICWRAGQHRCAGLCGSRSGGTASWRWRRKSVKSFPTNRTMSHSANSWHAGARPILNTSPTCRSLS
jgi:ribonuclease R